MQNIDHPGTAALPGDIWSRRQKAILCLMTLAVIVDGFDNQLLGFAVPALMQDWNLPKAAFSPILSFSLLAMTFGTALGGFCGDKFGRKPVLVASIFILALGTALAALSQNLSQLELLRWFAALGLGGAMPNAAAFLSEHTPGHRRSLAVSLAIIGVPIGGVLAGLVASVILTSYGWRYLFAAGGGLAFVIMTLVILLLPANSQSGADQETAAAGSFRFDFLSPAFRFRTLVLWGAFLSSLFAVYLTFSWTPTLLVGAGYSLGVASIGLAAFNFGSIAGAVAGGWLMDRTGSSAPLVIWSVLGTAVALAASATGIAGSGDYFVIGVMTALGLFAGSPQVMLFAVAAQLYPVHARAGGVGVALAIGRLGGVLSSYVGASLLTETGRSYFVAVAAAMILQTVFLTLGWRASTTAAK